MDARQKLVRDKMISEMVEFQQQREAMLDTPAANDMVYYFPRAMGVTMKNGKPEAQGAVFIEALPAGMSFHNGAGDKAEHMLRSRALRIEMSQAEEAIAVLQKME